MRATQFFISTKKEMPADAEVISHQLMLRAGMIRKMASGLYNWLPLGLRVLRKVESIVREEMDKSGALELLMPVVQPSELWQESERWQQYGPELLRIKDRHQREFCLGPTHEEVITDLVRNEINSYKQLPINFYQIQTKFRDEVRPRFGVMRAREFTMKDAYSFHSSQECLQRTYDCMHQTYCNIFDRIGLDYRPVLADTGSIGGSASHEFHVLADSGEDDIAFSSDSHYAANVELAEALSPKDSDDEILASKDVDTPNQKTIEEVASFLQAETHKTVKTLIVLGEQENDADETSAPLVALVLRGDHQLNEIKAEKLPGIATPLTFASEERIEKELGLSVGSIGPLNLEIPCIVDRSAATLRNFICGANKKHVHIQNANWPAQLPGNMRIADIRNICVGDPSPCGQGTIEIKRGIEVGHIFQLGKKYSQAMNANILDENGKQTTMIMGCYGIGVSRIVASAIEQNHDENGIIWPEAIAPFQLAIVPINISKSEAVAKTCEELYSALRKSGIDVLFMDEPKGRLGGMLADTELMGIPHRLVIGDRGLKEGKVEYKSRSAQDSEHVAVDHVFETLMKIFNKS